MMNDRLSFILSFVVTCKLVFRYEEMTTGSEVLAKNEDGKYKEHKPNLECKTESKT